MIQKKLTGFIAGALLFFLCTSQAHSATVKERITQCKEAGKNLRELNPSSYENPAWKSGKYAATFFLTEGSVKLLAVLSKNKISSTAASFVLGPPIEYGIDYINNEIFKTRISRAEKECLSKAKSGDKFDPVIFMFDNIGVKKENSPDSFTICHDGILYALDSTGSLYWYKHNEQLTEGEGWANGGTGIPVGYGWEELRKIQCADSGVIYAVDDSGDLLWYKHTGWKTGKNEWSNRGSGIIVGHGWGIYDRILYGGNGVIYAFKKNGDLFWYRHNDWNTGGSDWANDAKGQPIGNGWNGYISMLSFGNGVIYGLKENGDLLWYRHNGWGGGAIDWDNQGNGRLVGTGWNNYQNIFASSEGLIYAITNKRFLFLYNHKGWRVGDMNWSNRGEGVSVKKSW